MVGSSGSVISAEVGCAHSRTTIVVHISLTLVQFILRMSPVRVPNVTWGMDGGKRKYPSCIRCQISDGCSVNYRPTGGTICSFFGIRKNPLNMPRRAVASDICGSMRRKRLVTKDISTNSPLRRFNPLEVLRWTGLADHKRPPSISPTMT